MIKRIAAVLALLPALLAAQAPADKPSAKAQVIDMGSYKVTAPSGEGWEIDVDKKTDWVLFTKSKTGLLRQLRNKVRVMEVSVKSEVVGFYSWRMTEEDMADVIFTNYSSDQSQFLPWVKPARGVIEWGGKKLYSMKYHEARIPGPSTELTYFVYFPPDFAKSHRLFHFGFFRTLENPTMEPVQSIVGSLEIIDQLQGIVGPHGDLVRAAAAGNSEGVLEAIEKGADLNAGNPDRTALSAAAYHGHKEIVDLLLEKGAAVDTPDEKEGRTPLLAAIIGKEPEIAIRLIEKGADVNRRIKVGEAEAVSPLMLAMAIGHLGLARAIIDAGADLEARTGTDETALAVAAFNGWAEGAAMLLERGADANVRMTNGKTILMIAADKGFSEIVGMLLENKADPNLQATEDGGTALMIAAYGGYLDIVRALIDHGAQVNATSKDKAWTALALAFWKEEAKKDKERVLSLPSSRTPDLEIAKILIEAGADVNLKMDAGRTVLMKASDWGQTESVKLLIEKGADVNAKNNKGQSALAIAKKQKRAEIVKLLQAAGAK